MMAVNMRKLAWIALLSLVVDAGCSLDWTVPGTTPKCLSCVAAAAKGACASDHLDCCGDPACAACVTACTGPDCECDSLSAQGAFIRAQICFENECSGCIQAQCGP
jgi:hypothetical protein